MGSSPSVEMVVDSKDKAMRRSRETGERTVEEMAVIAEIGRLISSTLDIEEVYELFTAEVRKLIDFDRLAVNLCNSRENTIRVAYVSGGHRRSETGGFPRSGGHVEWRDHPHADRHAGPV